MATITVPQATRRFGPPRIGMLPRGLALCFIEARPVVQLVFLLRFLVGYELTASGRRTIVSGRFALAAVTLEMTIMAVYLFDGIMDIAEDRANQSTRPIASGRLSQGFAGYVVVLLAAGSMVGAAILGGPYPAATAVVLLLGYAYCGWPLRLKRTSITAGGTVLVAGILAFGWGAAAHPHPYPTPSLAILALAMSLWMGLVGALCKDFTDAPGDSRAGRRTSVIVRGRVATGILVRGNALLVAGVFTLLAWSYAPLLLVPALTVQLGAASICRYCSVLTPFGPDLESQLPYTIFMTTQLFALSLTLVSPMLLP
jgi:4-hydroxybenzoate polyprenyltransferase